MSRSDVTRYSRIPCSFWTDGVSSAWPDRVKLAAVYLQSCPHRHMEGIFKLPPQYACADLRWSGKSWNSALLILQESRFLKWDSLTNVVLLVDALRWQTPDNPNQGEAIIRRVKDLPPTILIKDFCALAIEHCYRKGAGSAAQAFAQLLNQQVRERFPQLFAPLNLETQSETQSEAKTEAQVFKSSGVVSGTPSMPDVTPLPNENEEVSKGRRGMHAAPSDNVKKFLPEHIRKALDL